jgi:signal transduction histidine kinase
MRSIEENQFFIPFGQEAKTRLLQAARRISYPDKTTIFEEDAVADTVYLVLSGNVALKKRTDIGTTITIAIVEPGYYFGEMGVIDRCGRSTSAEALGEIVLATIPGEIFLTLLFTEPGKVALKFLQQISSHLRQTNLLYTDSMIKKEKFQLISEMAGTIIHDFKSPVANIKISAGIIERKTKDAKIAYYIAIIRDQTENLMAMVEEILDYSQGKSVIQKERISIAEIFDAVKFSNQAYLKEHKIKLQIHSSSVLLLVDRRRILRVFQNMIRNATEALVPVPHPGKIILSVSPPRDGQIEIHISDNGPGIPMEVQTTLFEPFVSFGKQKGTGLGLAIARSIVEAHGGKISYQSKPGQGTTFSLQLPYTHL